VLAAVLATGYGVTHEEKVIEQLSRHVVVVEL
jgi:hypothetical protein